MKRVLITSGGTKVPIDSVRDITNMSHGTFGSQIATEFLNDKKWEVIFFSAKDGCQPLKTTLDFTVKSARKGLRKYGRWCEKVRSRYILHTYRTFHEYSIDLVHLLSCKPDLIILAAAVSDYVVLNSISGKTRSTEDLEIHLSKARKVISTIKELSPDSRLVGFKLLVGSTREDLIAAANKSIEDNHCDMIVANDLNDIKNDNHTLHLVWPQGLSGRLPKTYQKSDHPNLARIIKNEAEKL